MTKQAQTTMSKSHITLKQSFLAVALTFGITLTGSQMTYAASPNKAPPSIKAGAPQVYVVKKGDTLWDIAGRFLKSPWRWKEIWASNRHVKNPHWIYPGDRLLMCSLNGKPLIGKDEGDGCEGIIRRHTGAATAQPQVRIESLDSNIALIPLSYIQHWLQRSIIVSPENLTQVPYILGSADKRVLAAKGQLIYARGQGLEIGQRYAIYRDQEPYTKTIPSTSRFKKPKTQLIAQELLQVASAVATDIDDSGIVTLEITESYTGEVRHGNYVLPEYVSTLPEMFVPTLQHQVEEGGQVIRVMGGISYAALHGVITIDRGLKQGVEIGHVFTVKQQGEVVKDPKSKEPVRLPAQEVGNIMVFKAFDNMSYAYVLDSALPIHVGNTIHPSELTD